jgi:hypothetical protein
MPVELKGSTSGSVTLAAPAVAGTGTTITTPARSGNMAVDGPAFSAYASAAQTVTSNTATKVNIDTEDFDTNSCFDTSNKRFLPNVAGYYQINGIIRFNASTSATQLVTYLYKNGSIYAGYFLWNGTLGAANFQATANDIIYLNGTTDYVELWGSVTGTGTCSFPQTANFTSRFSGCLVRAA